LDGAECENTVLHDALLSADTTFRSTDGGETWISSTGGSAHLNAVTYANNVFVAVGDSGAIITSADGISWTKRTDPEESTLLNSITYVEGSFIVVGENGIIRISTDNGVKWITQNSGTSKTLRDMVYAEGTLVAVGNRVVIWN